MKTKSMPYSLHTFDTPLLTASKSVGSNKIPSISPQYEIASWNVKFFWIIAMEFCSTQIKFGWISALDF